MAGYHLDKRIELGSARDFVLRYVNKAGDAKLVVWTAPPSGQSPDATKPHTVQIPATTVGPVEAVQIYGDKQTVEVKDGSIEVKLTGAPQYLVLPAAKK